MGRHIQAESCMASRCQGLLHFLFAGIAGLIKQGAEFRHGNDMDSFAVANC